MKATFLEVSGFSDWREDFLPDPAYAQLQIQLMANPDLGDVMPGCGGLRKLRIADPERRKGKRGGARVIYAYFPEAKRFYMIDIYGKNEKDDLSAAEKTQFRKIVELSRLHARHETRTSQKRKA